MEGVLVVEESMLAAEAYEAVSIAYPVAFRLDLARLEDSQGTDFKLLAATSFTKDYDECPEDRPTNLAARFNVDNWSILSAHSQGVRIGGAILARSCPQLDMLEGRDDLAVIMDIRVAPAWRGQGVGKMLMASLFDWAARQGCREVKVETQDINVDACRFYAAHGFRLAEINRGAYEGLDEVQLIWRRPCP